MEVRLDPLILRFSLSMSRFHFRCTALKSMPSDKEQWYCESCAKKIKKKKLKK